MGLRLPRFCQQDRVNPPGDLARMLSGLGREQDMPNLMMMRRLIELERGLNRGLSIER